jgi:uncharacterized protein YxjI
VSNALVSIEQANELFVVQRRELAELFGFETRNKYSIELGDTQLAFAAEQGKGGLAFLARQFFGHWRRFEVAFFDSFRSPLMRATQPFRWFFQRLEVALESGRPLGALQQRFGFLYKRFDVLDPSGRVSMQVASPFWRPWTFSFQRDGREVARIEKKWSGLLREAFTDGDRFRIAFVEPLALDERLLLLAAAIFVDLRYFEHKAD